jgi:hypothetical protein
MNEPPSLFDLGCRDMAVTCWRRSNGRRRKWTHDYPACNEQKHKTFIRRPLFSLFSTIPMLGILFRKGAPEAIYSITAKVEMGIYFFNLNSRQFADTLLKKIGLYLHH